MLIFASVVFVIGLALMIMSSALAKRDARELANPNAFYPVRVTQQWKMRLLGFWMCVGTAVLALVS